MACGEGYGVEVLARRARRVTGVDANPEAHEHARLKYTRPGVRFVRDLVETYEEPCDAVVFLQTIEHVRGRPQAVLAALPRHAAAGRTRLRVHAEPAHARAARGGEVGQPLAPEGVPRRRVPRALRERLRARRAARPLPRARCCARTSSRCAPAGTACTPALGITKPFYDRFTPAISARDFALRAGPLDRALDFVAVLRP